MLEHVVNPVGSKADAHTAHPRHAEDAREVVIPPASADAAHRRIDHLHFEDGTRVVVQAPCQTGRKDELGLTDALGGGQRPE